jgi:hypothetical protein
MGEVTGSVRGENFILCEVLLPSSKDVCDKILILKDIFCVL